MGVGYGIGVGVGHGVSGVTIVTSVTKPLTGFGPVRGFVLSIVQVLVDRDLVKLKIFPRVRRHHQSIEARKLAVEADTTLP